MFTLGCDPEFWLTDRDTGRPRSAHDMVPGTKAEPCKVEGGTVQADGTAVEIGIIPAHTKKEFCHNLTMVLNEVRRIVPYKYRFDFTPWRRYTPAQWDRLPDHAKEIGCDPEEYVWRVPAMKPRVRTRGLGGHVHIGWTKGKKQDDAMHNWDARTFIKEVSATAQSWYEFYVDGTSRYQRTGYGKYDAHRVKPYGVEYRAWNSRWVSYPDLWPHVWDFWYNCFHLLGEDKLGLPVTRADMRAAGITKLEEDAWRY